MVKSKKDNVLKPNDIPAPGQFRVQFHFFLLFQISELFSSNNITFVFGIYIEEYKAFLF